MSSHHYRQRGRIEAGGSDRSQVTLLLVEDARQRRADDAEVLAESVYGDLCRMSAASLRRERNSNGIEALDVAHEAWPRLVARVRRGSHGRAQLVALASLCVHRVLIDQMRRRDAAKRMRDGVSGEAVREPTEAAPDPELMDLRVAMQTLAQVDGRWARVVELRFFAGLSVAEVASELDISPATVKRDWQEARWFLRGELEGPRAA